MAEQARVLIEATAGMIPGAADPTFTRKWAILGDEWDQAGLAAENEQLQLLLDRLGEAQAYATRLAIQSASGQAPNWVRLDWIWL